MFVESHSVTVEHNHQTGQGLPPNQVPIGRFLSGEHQDQSNFGRKDYSSLLSHVTVHYQRKLGKNSRQELDPGAMEEG